MEATDSDPYLQTLTFILTLFRGDFDTGVIIVSLVIFVLLIFSAAISGSEIAYFFLNPAQIEEIESSKSKTKGMVTSIDFAISPNDKNINTREYFKRFLFFTYII